MTDGTLFHLSNGLALLGWIPLFFAPRWTFGREILAPLVVPGLLALFYLTLFLISLTGEQGGFGTLDQVAAFFSSPRNVLFGWVHYLAFDLFIGAWQARDCKRLGIHHGLLVPCMFFTFMLGPVGWLCWMIVRTRVAGTRVGTNPAQPRSAARVVDPSP